MEDTVYLGDGAYIRKLEAEEMFVVYAHNGISLTDQVYFDIRVAQKLKNYLIEKLPK